MNTNDFTQHPQVLSALQNAHHEINNKVFSDVIDAQGKQYVDLVMEGGGVLGIALVGYTYALEQFGLRFRSTGGTSAGAINAIFLQAMGSPEQARSTKMIEHVANMPMRSFQDGGVDGKFFVKSWLGRHKLLKMSVFGILDDLFKHLGLNPGDKFLRWVKRILKQQNVETWQALKNQMRVMPEGLHLRTHDGTTQEISAGRFSPSLKVVTAELTTTTKIVLPERDGHLFYHDLDSASPADFARASMSVPFFFHPFRIKNIPIDHVAEWKTRLGYDGDMPDEVVFVDGGIVSNFPINLFHVHSGKPSLPTFGVKLGTSKSELKTISGVFPMIGAMIDVMRHDADDEFLSRNPDYKQLVQHIDTGEHHWLNFNLSPDEKIDLFVRGVEAAVLFLKRFDWEAYKSVR
jgi:NTE family protein